VSCIGSFAAGLSKHRGQWQQRRWWFFSSFWLVFCLYSNSFDDAICLNDWQGLVPIRIVDRQFYTCQLFSALAAPATKYCACVEAQMEGDSSF
jgi:hypothetical protein